MSDYTTQEDAMNMSLEQAIAILIPMRDMMLDQHSRPISDAYYALDKVIKYVDRRGRWIDGKRMGFDGTFHWFKQCSECLYEREDDTLEKDTKYCPNCGAKMEE